MNIPETEKNRQTGRTTRIVYYIVEQLMNHGECISTDHTAYEYKGNAGVRKSLLHLSEKVDTRIREMSNGSYRAIHRFVNVNGIEMLHFTMQKDYII